MKMYLITKFVKAKSTKDALKIERTQDVDSIEMKFNIESKVEEKVPTKVA